jgi:hypothetical protein
MNQGPELHANRQRPRLHKQRIVHIIQPSAGGIIKQLGYICRELDRTKFDVHLIWTLMPGDPPYAEAYQDVGLYRVDMTREISPWRDLLAFLAIFRLLRKLRPDIVHSHSSKAGVVGRIAAFLARVPRVFYSAQGYSFLRTDIGPLARRAYFGIEWVVSHLVGTVIAVSPGEAEAAKKVAPRDRVVIVENCIDPDEFEPSDHASNHNDQPLVVGVIGRITPAKDPALFIEIAEALLESAKSVPLSFVWVGDGELRTEVEARLRTSSLKGKFEITGWVSFEDARAWLKKIDIVVMPSRWEGLPLALLEAMAASKPVVVSDVVGNRTTVVHGTTGFIVRDKEGYLSALHRLISDGSLRTRMGMAGRERAIRLFSVKTAIRKLEQVYTADSPKPRE